MSTLVINDQQATHRSPSGLPLRHLVSGELDSAALYVGEQWLQAGDRVLRHTHPVEEVLLFTAGVGEVQVEEESFAVSAGVTVHISAGEAHGFQNVGQDELRLYVIFPGNQFARTDLVDP